MYVHTHTHNLHTHNYSQIHTYIRLYYMGVYIYICTLTSHIFLQKYKLIIEMSRELVGQSNHIMIAHCA